MKENSNSKKISLFRTPKKHVSGEREPRRFGRAGGLVPLSFLIFCALWGNGCGTSKMSDTSRTATEMLLISSAMEDVVDEFDFSPLTGLNVYVNTTVKCTDNDYFLAVLRQQLAANGVMLKDLKEEAEYILEVAPGAVGTNRYERMYGVPETTIPGVVSGGTSTTIPEMALIKRTDQLAEVKVMLWAYNKKTGAIIWQSGTKKKTAHLRDRWFFGAGPFTQASYENNIQIAGEDIKIKGTGEYISSKEKPSVKTEAIYREVDQESLTRLNKIRQEGFEKYSLLSDSADQAAEQATEQTAGQEEPSVEGDDAAAKEKDEKEIPPEGETQPVASSETPTGTPSETGAGNDAALPLPLSEIPRSDRIVDLTQILSQPSATSLALPNEISTEISSSANLSANSTPQSISTSPSIAMPQRSIPSGNAASSASSPSLVFDHMTLPLQTPVRMP